MGFLVNDYASDVLAAYRGKGLAEIGVEVCKASIAQRIPFLDALVQEFATPANPPQFTAYFEEASYAPTLGKSLYSVYLHVYAGTPQREGQTLNYLVYLRSFGSSPRLVVDSGSLSGDQSADKNIDLIGDAGYQEVCVVLNGLEQCGFGRVVSSSFLISGVDDYLASIDLAREIKTAAQCKAEPTAPVTYTVQTGALPFARVRRVCSLSNPGLGLGEDNSWRRVGNCGFNERGISMGDCWEFGDLSRYPETAKLALDLSCRNGEICEANQKCTGHELRDDPNGRVCCVGGKCENIAAFDIAREAISTSSLPPSEIDRLKDDYNQKRITSATKLKPEGAFALGSYICSTGQLHECEKFFDQIPRSEKTLYAKAHLIIGDLLYSVKNNPDDAYSHLKKVNKEDLDTEENKTKFDKLLEDIEDKLKETKEKSTKDQQVNKLRQQSEKLIVRINKLRQNYNHFETVSNKLNEVSGSLVSFSNKIKSDKDKDQVLLDLDSAIDNLNKIKVQEDEDYKKKILDILNAIKSDINGIAKESDLTKQISARAVIASNIDKLKSTISQELKNIEDIGVIITKLTTASSSLNSGAYISSADELTVVINLLGELLQKPIDGLMGDIKKFRDDLDSVTNENPQQNTK